MISTDNCVRPSRPSVCVYVCTGCPIIIAVVQSTFLTIECINHIPFARSEEVFVLVYVDFLDLTSPKSGGPIDVLV